MTSVIAAEGAILERLLDRRWRTSSNGLTREAYGTFHAARTKTPWATRCQRAFALVDGHTILASADQYNLTGVLDGRTVRVCGIGAVCADPSQPGPGHASTLIGKLLETAEREGAEMALLFSDTPVGPVGPVGSVGPVGDETGNGFYPIQPKDLTLVVTESLRHGAPMATVRGGEPRDVAAIVAMGRVRAAPFRFHLDRDVDFVQYAITTTRLLAGLGTPHARQLHFFIAEEGITAAAYVIVSVVGHTWTLEACGDRDPSGARVGGLLQALIAREPNERRPTIHAWLPAHFLPPQVTIASALPSADVLRVRMLGSHAGTTRPLSWDDVLYWRSDLL